MSAVKDYRDLTVWQTAMQLVNEVYKLVKLLPREEVYVLPDQMRRSAVAVPSNIAEGFGRRTGKEYVQFLSISRGSLFELQTQIEIAIMQDFFPKDQTETVLHLAESTSKMINSLIRSIQNPKTQAPEPRT